MAMDAPPFPSLPGRPLHARAWASALVKALRVVFRERTGGAQGAARRAPPPSLPFVPELRDYPCRRRR